MRQMEGGLTRTYTIHCSRQPISDLSDRVTIGGRLASKSKAVVCLNNRTRPWIWIVVRGITVSDVITYPP